MERGTKVKEEVYLVQEGAYWAKIQTAAQNTVVQIFAQVGRFNWLEPYKIEEQYENRGSGFLINERGYLITNAHVIDNAKHIWIHIPALGQQPLTVNVVGVCPDRDLALLRLTDSALQNIRSQLGGIPYLSFGDSDYVQRADSVLVLGYPLGQYRLKSATGIISGRELMFGQSLIQITAPVNVGSSGGPLLNTRGEVIGIATAMISFAHNIGYAIPINELRIIIDDLYTDKFVRKPFFGARFVFASDEKAQFLHNPIPAGLYISTVFKGSLFEKIGVQAGDMLYEFHGFRLDPYGETNVPWTLDKVSLYELASRMKVGDTIGMVIYRHGKRMDIQFTVEFTEPFAIRRKYPDYEPIVYDMIGGLIIMELTVNHIPLLMKITPTLIKYKEPENRIDPVLIITHILPGSYASQLRTLRPGDIIRDINGNLVTTIEEWKQAVQKSLTTGLLTLKTDRDVLVVFSLARLLAEEQQLSKAFSYPITATIDQLQKKL